ncbi:MAG: hypothetical protein EA374_01185 [Acholeplasmatales bacterium]|nr:MAG: hypothetical protein EA374_01185 [Acholeplasmatales bacterium]
MMTTIRFEATTLAGHEATLVHVDSGAIKAVLCSRGASIIRLETADRHGVFDNVVLSYQNLDDFYQNPKYLGATTGPYAGRIYPPEMTVGGKRIALEKNFQNHAHLHGGSRSLARADFTVEAIDQGVCFTHIPTEPAYPGHVFYKAYYRFEGPVMTLEYETLANADTYTNLTQHAYFNLSGSIRRTVLDHTLCLPASHVGQLDASLITERLIPVEGTLFDFRRTKTLREVVIPLKKTPQMGLDHPFVLDEGTIVLADPESGRALHIETDQDTVVVYSHNFIIDQPVATPLEENQHLALCLETQHYPNDLHFFTRPASAHPEHTHHRQMTRYTFK